MNKRQALNSGQLTDELTRKLVIVSQVNFQDIENICNAVSCRVHCAK
jgi:DNA-binding Xre family transcriptional regulator